MTTQPLELEGTWEEILTHAPELAGRRVKLVVLPEQSETSPSQPPVYRPASGRSLLRHSGTWAGNDFEESLQAVYDNRSPLEF